MRAQGEWLAEGRDRRRIPRYVCSGTAQISCLPMVGTCLRGRLRDLGLGGCWIEGIQAAIPLNLGAQAELLVEVNSWVFRALGHVRALRDRSGISVEFARLSAGGYTMLGDVIAELEKPRIVVARPKIEIESLQLGEGGDSGPSIVGVAEPVLPPQAPLASLTRLFPGGRVIPLSPGIDIFI
jgi:hypothetical protein